MSRKTDRCWYLQISFATPTGVTHRCEDHRCIDWQRRMLCRNIFATGSTEARLERDKSAVIRSYGERRGPLFALVSFDIRVPITAISRFASPNFALGTVFSPYEISFLAEGDPSPAFDGPVESDHLPARRVVSPAFSIRCRSRADLAPISRSVPCTASITVPLENRYRLDLTITYRDHSTLLVFVKIKHRDAVVYFGGSWRMTCDGHNWLLRKESF